jgi:hypothetical protein
LKNETGSEKDETFGRIGNVDTSEIMRKVLRDSVREKEIKEMEIEWKLNFEIGI